jgi:hypothetical protein
MATSAATGLPGVRGKGETGRFKRAFVDLAGDFTQEGPVMLVESDFFPYFFQGTRFQVDVERVRVTPDDLGRKQAAFVGHTSYKCVPQAGKISGGELTKLLTNLRAAPVGRALENRHRLPLANLLPEFIEDRVVQNRPVLKRGDKFFSQSLFTHRITSDLIQADSRKQDSSHPNAAGPQPKRVQGSVRRINAFLEILNPEP